MLKIDSRKLERIGRLRPSDRANLANQVKTDPDAGKAVLEFVSQLLEDNTPEIKTIDDPKGADFAELLVYVAADMRAIFKDRPELIKGKFDRCRKPWKVALAKTLHGGSMYEAERVFTDLTFRQLAAAK